MVTERKIVAWDDLRVLVTCQGLSISAAANKIGINKKTVFNQIDKYQPDLSDLSQVPESVFKKWNCPLPEWFNSSDEPDADLDVNWHDVKEYLATGLLIEETAAACGLDVQSLKDAYLVKKPSPYDTIETWAMVLRARRNFELIKAIEKRAMNGDLRAAVVVSKLRAQRFPKDGPPPLTNIKGLL